MRANSVRRRRVALPDSPIEIALLDWGGSGPLALLHHANGFCAGIWGLVAERLRERFRVVAMDARGHGESSKPAEHEAYEWRHFANDVAAVARVLAREGDSNRVALAIGHSFGGTSILAAAAENPQLFDRLLLVDPVIVAPAHIQLDEARFARKRGLAEGARRRRQLWRDRAAARAWWAEREFFADWQPAALDLYATWGLRDRDDGQVELACAGETEAMIFEMSGSLDPFALAGRVLAPARVLWARRGNFPRPLYERLVARMPRAHVQDVDAGHLVPMERPDRVAEEALAFAADALQRSMG